MSKKTSIAIIGAGLSGLAAAYEISKRADCTVTVFEAESTPGGRVKSLSVDGHSVDVGGFIIYPWYTEYHRLINELGLANKLKKINDVRMYYQFDAGGPLFPEERIPVSMTQKLKLGSQLLPLWLRARPDFRSPDLETFGDQTIARYLEKKFKSTSSLVKFMDCVNQGYCYAGLHNYQMAFYAPFIYQTLVHGDLRTGYYFGGDNNIFARALAKGIEKNGGVIHYECPVIACNKKNITTHRGDQLFDSVVFAQPVNELYKNTISAPLFPYTHFYAAVVRIPEALSLKNDPLWTALFTAPRYPECNQITSLIRAEGMVPALDPGYLIINFKTISKSVLPEKELAHQLQSELHALFPEIITSELITYRQWQETMPCATTEFVSEVRAKQGFDGYYFAGDYLGAPSMETALSSGVAVAASIAGELDK
jgi:protoporphyrinogen oxidase